MASEELKPTYIGDNDGLVFVVPTELFKMKMSPEKRLDPETAKKFGKYIKETFKGFQKALKTKHGNENNVKTETTPEFWQEFENKAKKMGIDLIGYTPIDPNYVFKKLKIYGKNGIVLGMEMKWDKIKTAPSVHGAIEAFRVYKELGERDFREKERASLISLKEKRDAVIATGGGVVLCEENRSFLKEKGVVVSITLEKEVLFERWKKKPLAFLKEENFLSFIREREALYQNLCDVNLLYLKKDQTLKELIEIWRKRNEKSFWQSISDNHLWRVSR